MKIPKVLCPSHGGTDAPGCSGDVQLRSDLCSEQGPQQTQALPTELGVSWVYLNTEQVEFQSFRKLYGISKTFSI